MYIERVPNRNSPPAVLLRESYREGNKVKKRTLANLSKLPDDIVDNFKLVLKGGKIIEDLEAAIALKKSLPYGHLGAILGILKQGGLDQVLDSEKKQRTLLILSLAIWKMISLNAPLNLVRELTSDPDDSALETLLGQEMIPEDEFYQLLDCLLENQAKIETELAQNNLESDSLILYELSANDLEWFSLDHNQEDFPLAIGLLCNPEGCPLALEWFPKNITPSSLVEKINKLRQKWGIKSLIWVTNHGMSASSYLNQELRASKDFKWIIFLSENQVNTLVEAKQIKLELFEENQIAEVFSSDHPKERLIAYQTPGLLENLKQQREESIQATMRELDAIAAATQCPEKPLKGAGKIGLAVGKVIDKYHVEQLFEVEITEESFSYNINPSFLEAEAVKDGLNVIQTNLSCEEISDLELVKYHQNLSQLKFAFASRQKIDVQTFPIFPHCEKRVRAYLVLVLLASYIEWQARSRLAPLFSTEQSDNCFPDQVRETPQPKRNSKKKEVDETRDNLATLLRGLESIYLHQVEAVVGGQKLVFEKISQINSWQKRILDLLEVSVLPPDILTN
jgi:hypothetical protein